MKDLAEKVTKIVKDNVDKDNIVILKEGEVADGFDRLDERTKTHEKAINGLSDDVSDLTKNLNTLTLNVNTVNNTVASQAKSISWIRWIMGAVFLALLIDIIIPYAIAN